VVWRVEQDDHWAGGFAHDLVDQIERVLGAFPESDERDVGSLSGCNSADVSNVDLARYHLVAERGDDWSDEREAILALVRDQNAEGRSRDGSSAISALVSVELEFWELSNVVDLAINCDQAATLSSVISSS
jgi:hypothetical protein